MEDFGGETDVPYATTFGLFNTGGPQIGDYSNPTADSLINASISGGDPAAVKNEASFLTDEPAGAVPAQPGLTSGPGRTRLSAQNPQAWENLTQYYATPEYWYFNK